MRFPEFSDEWKENRLVEVTSKVNSGKTPLGGDAVYTDAGVLFIRSQNVVNDKLDLGNSTYIPNHVNEGMKNSIVEANDILLNITGASLGRSCVVPENFIKGNVNQHVCIIRTKEGYNPKFIQPFFSSQKGQSLFQSLQTGSGREGLNFENIKNIKIAFPTLAEQNKIAKFLEIIHDRIETQNKIIEQLESLIKAIGQYLFSQDRYEFNNLKLGEICEIKKGEQINGSELTEFGQYPVINGGITPSGFHSEYNCNADTISISEGGNSCGFVQFNKNLFWSGGHCYSLNKVSTNVLNKYLFYFLKYSESKIMSLRVGSGLPNIQRTAISNFNVLVPNEQTQKLAIKILDSIYDKRSNEMDLLDFIKNQKHYLLCSMFK